MSAFEYSTTLGDYNDRVRLDISLKIKDIGVSSEEYDQLKVAFGMIEEICQKYRNLVDVEEESEQE